MEWVRGDKIGHGTFGRVNLAKPINQNSQFPSIMAVKSSGISHTPSLMCEKRILDELRDSSPHIIQCFGDSFTFENGERLYNVLLEYASGGDLADKIKKSGDCGLSESDVRRYTKSILSGIDCIHKNGFVHCDIKPQNILLFDSENSENDDVKIADFGLAKRAGEGSTGDEMRGTFMYMSPEVVVCSEQESPADIWALGCVVAEMVTGAPAWRSHGDSDFFGLVRRIGISEEVPEIPGKLSEEGKDFLGKCFLKDPTQRWTAEMLLNHPFVSDQEDEYETVPLKNVEEVPSTSPRSPFGLPDWVSSVTCSFTSLPLPDYLLHTESWFLGELTSCCKEVPSTSPRMPDWMGLQSPVTCSITSLPSPEYLSQPDSMFLGEFNSCCKEVPSTSPRSPFGFSDSVVGLQSSGTCSITSLPSPEYLSQPESLFLGELNSCCKEVPSTSPRSPFAFSDWVVGLQSLVTHSITSLPSLEYLSQPESMYLRVGELNSCCGSLSNSPVERLRQLVTDERPDWPVSESWVTLRLWKSQERGFNDILNVF